MMSSAIQRLRNRVAKMFLIGRNFKSIIPTTHDVVEELSEEEENRMLEAFEEAMGPLYENPDPATEFPYPSPCSCGGIITSVYEEYPNLAFVCTGHDCEVNRPKLLS